MKKMKKKLPTSTAQGIRTSKNKSMRLLLPRGTLKKRVPTAPGQTQNDKRK
jgi:hypothetical protein